MEIILRRDVEKLGKRGEVVRVSNGYARNYLLPKGLACKVTPGALKQIQLEEQKRERAHQKRLQQLHQLAERLSRCSCTVSARAQEDGELYGSVNAKMIAEALRQEGIEISEEMVILREPFKALGVYPVEIDLGEGIRSTTTVWIVGSE